MSPAEMTIAALSAAFTKGIREECSPIELCEIDSVNLYVKDTCSTHDYTDPNITMHHAFELVFGRPPDLHNEDDLWLINAAWDKSKAEGFAP